MEIILSHTKKIAFAFEGLTGVFICSLPKAGDFVAFWTAFRAVDGNEETKAKKQAELVLNTFTKHINSVEFDQEVTFKKETGEPVIALEALKEFYSFHLYTKGMEFLNPTFGNDADPLGSNSGDS